MSKHFTGKGKSYDLAVEAALRNAQASHDDIESIKIIQQAENGVFGFFGRKDAIVEIELKQEEVPVETIDEVITEIPSEPDDIQEETNQVDFKNKAELAKQFLDELFKNMGIECEVQAQEEDGFLKINLIGERMGVLIGRRGQTLDAIQYLTSLAVNKEGEEYTRVLLDTEDYRNRRQKTLEDLADKMANKALRYHKRIRLEPMNPAERRIIHAHLQKNKQVTTYSEGNDPYRRIVIQVH